tara:strand:+ start:1014 stop:1181 length:168 start_codon:yes stop_codon:yes gene_type:complete
LAALVFIAEKLMNYMNLHWTTYIRELMAEKILQAILYQLVLNVIREKEVTIGWNG